MTLISNDHCCFYYLEKPNYTWLPQVHFEMLLLVCEYKSLGNTLSLGRGERCLSLLMLQTWWEWFPTLAAQLASRWPLGLAPSVSNKIGLDARTLQVGHGQPGKWAWTKSQTVTIYFLLLFSNQIPKYFNTLAALCEELTHWKRPWCWERLRAGGERGGKGWDGWMASPAWWTWVWASSGK